MLSARLRPMTPRPTTPIAWFMARNFSLGVTVTGIKLRRSNAGVLSHASRGVNALARSAKGVVSCATRDVNRQSSRSRRFLRRACCPGWRCAADRPNSKVNGVTIGMNVPYNFGNQATSAEDILQRLRAAWRQRRRIARTSGRSVHGTARQSAAAAWRRQSRRRAGRTAAPSTPEQQAAAKARLAGASASGAWPRRSARRETSARCTKTPA